MKQKMLKLLACTAFIMVLSAFNEDACKPTDDQVRSLCEYSSTQICNVFWIGGPCDGKTYPYPYNRAK
jgi:hypothetical protein